MLAVRWFGVAAALLVLAGCVASAPLSLDLQQRAQTMVQTPPPGKAVVVVYRGSLPLLPIPVCINQTELGRIGKEQYVVAVVDRGTHRLSVSGTDFLQKCPLRPPE